VELAVRFVKDAKKLAAVPAIGLPVFFLFWLVFVGTFSLHELLIGIVATLLATAGLLVVNFHYPARFSPTTSELLSLWRICWYLLSGTGEIVMVAAKDLLGIKPAQSLFRVVTFDTGSKDDPRATARSALAVIYTTIAPNFIVLGVNANHRTLLFHQIERSSVPKMILRLGAQA
jgi:multisubunit Na+/H+ antiporter MnhE subunit